MDEEQRHGVASDAKATTSDQTPSSLANATDVSGVASDASVAALDDGIRYTLTAEQALERIGAAGRKVPSLRSLQRHCDEGTLRATKIKTTYGQEWLINETSLAQYITRQPRLEVGVAGDATVTPPSNSLSKSASVTDAIGDAGVASNASAISLPVPAGERRSVAEVLIENAKLLAQNEGKDQIIVELKDDRAFLREEVREARKHRDDTRSIAEKMLQTLQAMALGRHLNAPQESEVAQAEIIKPNDQPRT